MRYTPQELILLRLRGKRIRKASPSLLEFMDELHSKSAEECFAMLRDLAGEDFGKDLDL